MYIDIHCLTCNGQQASSLSLSLHFYTNYSGITSTYLEFACKISQIYKVLCEVFLVTQLAVYHHYP